MVVADAGEVHNEVSGTVTGPVVQAGRIGELHVHPARSEVVIPRQLPAAPGPFVGRAGELAVLTAALGDDADQGTTMVVSAIGGAGGMGKTWLALHWAHGHLDRFPDGQLFVDLRGFAPSGKPMTPAAAVRGFLDALGVDPAAIPVDLDAQAGLYRSLIAGKRMLLVLDNARDAAQVAGLLPGSPSCTVIVTSRNRLAGLVTAHGAYPVAVDVFEESDARALLTRRLGAKGLAGEPHAVAEVLAWCAGLPLALSIVASRAALRPRITLGALAAELRDASTRLDALDEGDPAASLQAVLSWSYAALEPTQARTFCLLALAPGPDISVSAAASLAALPTDRLPLRALELRSLLEQHAAGRYRMHDLIRLYAADQAQRDQSEQDRAAALRRLVDFYLHTAFAGDRQLDPDRAPIELDEPVAGCRPQALADEAAALIWFDTEHSNLLAAQQLAVDHGWHRAVWQLAWALDDFHMRRGHVHNQVAAWRAGLAAAEHLSDVATQTRAHRLLGAACARVGNHTEARDHLQQALTLAEDSGDLSGQAHTHHALAVAWERTADDRRALEHATRALHLFHTLGNPMREAATLNAVGWLRARLGDFDQAQTDCGAALRMFRHQHHREGEAVTLDSLGYIAHQTGRHTRALDYYQQALTLFRDLGDTYQEADTLDRIGQTDLALGRRDRAVEAWRDALALYQAQHRKLDADRVQEQLTAKASFPGRQA